MYDDEEREPFEGIDPKALRQARALSTKRLRTGWPRQAVLQDLEYTHGLTRADAETLVNEIAESIKGLPLDTRSIKPNEPSKLKGILVTVICLAIMVGVGIYIYISFFKKP